MIEHASLGTHHYDKSVRFYEMALTPLAFALLRDTGKEAAFGTPDRWCFFLYPVATGESVVAKGTHIALGATSREAVAAVHAAALAAGAEDIFSPHTRPDISDTYFGAMFKDLDGHQLEVLTHAA
jgi:catechol 2,3-dioxygenase-like lactoylglutathione lyase family enzyme